MAVLREENMLQWGRFDSDDILGPLANKHEGSERLKRMSLRRYWFSSISH